MNITMPGLALVYHTSRITARPYLAAIVACPQRQHAEMLEEVFESTNHIEGNWTHNNNVLSTGFHEQQRSTSAGDYVQIGIHLYRCDPTGWTHVAPTKWQLIKSFFVGDRHD